MNLHFPEFGIGCNVAFVTELGSEAYLNKEGKIVVLSVKDSMQEVLNKLVMDYSRGRCYTTTIVANFSYSQVARGLLKTFKEVWNVVQEIQIAGGHGNPPCTLAVVDLIPMYKDRNVEIRIW